mmetsp:Transcript_12596/g.53155  ORF Transcript_12596/g.53155 Transcript_12596/m.53155 type:complete len:591 (-) Transcript_12596:540-2312(-)
MRLALLHVLLLSVTAHAPWRSLVVRPVRRPSHLLRHGARKPRRVLRGRAGGLNRAHRASTAPPARLASANLGHRVRGHHVRVGLSLQHLPRPLRRALAVEVERQASRGEQPDGDPPEGQHHVGERHGARHGKRGKAEAAKVARDVAREGHEEERRAEEALVELRQRVPGRHGLVRVLLCLNLLLARFHLFIHGKRLALSSLILDGVLHVVHRREGGAGHGDHRDAEGHRAGHLPVVGLAVAHVSRARRRRRRRRRRSRRRDVRGKRRRSRRRDRRRDRPPPPPPARLQPPIGPTGDRAGALAGPGRRGGPGHGVRGGARPRRAQVASHVPVGTPGAPCCPSQNKKVDRRSIREARQAPPRLGGVVFRRVARRRGEGAGSAEGDRGARPGGSDRGAHGARDLRPRPTRLAPRHIAGPEPSSGAAAALRGVGRRRPQRQHLAPAVDQGGDHAGGDIDGDRRVARAGDGRGRREEEGRLGASSASSLQVGARRQDGGRGQLSDVVRRRDHRDAPRGAAPSGQARAGPLRRGRHTRAPVRGIQPAPRAATRGFALRRRRVGSRPVAGLVPDRSDAANPALRRRQRQRQRQRRQR